MGDNEITIEPENDAAENAPLNSQEEVHIEMEQAEVNYQYKGELSLESYDDQKAKYIVIKPYENSDSQTEDDFYDGIFKYMRNPKKFDLSKPSLIISVTGGAKIFTISEETKTAFKQALMKVAANTNAWIITGGTDTGVMKLVGDAIKEDIAGNNQTVIGIASWNRITYKEKEVKHEKSETVLNPNHSCFILVDNENNGAFGGEIDLRTKLEQRIKEKLKIPLILIALEGGIGTLKTISGALEYGFAILIIEKTKGCADVIKEMIRLKKEKKSNKDIVDELLKMQTFRGNLESRPVLEKMLEKDANFDSCLNICDLHEEENKVTIDVEKMILNALSKVQEDPFSRIKLAIKWDRVDIAKPELEKYTFNASTDLDGRNEIEDLFELAVLQNNPEFIELLMRKGQFNLNEFLTVQRLKNLYNNDEKDQKRPHHEPLFFYLQQETLTYSKGQTDHENITFSDIKKFLKLNFVTIKTKFLPTENDGDTIKVKEPEFNLFLWSVFSNRIESAKLFWRIGKNHIRNALMAAKILKFFANYLQDDKILFRKHAKDFEDLAIGILDVFEEHTRDAVNDVLVIRYLDILQMDCLQLAVDSDCMEFVSHRVPQRALENLWNGNESKSFYALTKYENDLKSCQQRYNDSTDYILNNAVLRECNKNPNPWNKIIKFFILPKTKFVLHSISYLLFLLLFTHIMLFKIDNPEVGTENNSSNISENYTANSPSNEICLLNRFIIFYNNYKETILFIWVLLLLIEEFRQLVYANTKYGIKLMLLKYIKNEWNALDFLGCMIFIFGYILHVSVTKTHIVSQISRLIFSVDLVLWYMRSLQLWLIFSKIGPKLYMIKKMTVDLFYFLVILATILLAFGVALQAIIDPYTTHDYRIIFKIFDKAYWSIFGEITLFDVVKYENCDNSTDEVKCLDPYTYFTSYLLLMVYMILASVLLINLLIALFSSTHDKIAANSDIVWKNQLYSLISEYVELTFLPPPFTFIPYLWYFVEYLVHKCNKKVERVTKQPIVSLLIRRIHSKPTNGRNTENNILIDLERKCVEKLLKKPKHHNKT